MLNFPGNSTLVEGRVSDFQLSGEEFLTAFYWLTGSSGFSFLLKTPQHFQILIRSRILGLWGYQFIYCQISPSLKSRFIYLFIYLFIFTSSFQFPSIYIIAIKKKQKQKSPVGCAWSISDCDLPKFPAHLFLEGFSVLISCFFWPPF